MPCDRTFPSSPIRSILRKLGAIGFAAMLLGACAGDEVSQEYVELPVEQLYNDAVNALEQEEYAIAAQRFDEVERQHPYSDWSTKAQMMAAYSLYMANSYDEAVLSLDRFIQLHPSHKDVAYAYYLKGLTYYEQISDVGRDQKMTQQSLKAFNELITRFPDSEYTPDAKLKLELTHDHLAGKEMDIGRYYLGRGQYLAAINRFSAVVDQYQTTTHVPEALHRMVESYLALGVIDEARKVAAVLGHNYPSSEWYLDSYAILEDPNVRAETENPWYKLW